MPDTTQVNWAEVADRLINLGEDAAIQVGNTIQQYAPDVWEMAYRQVIVEVVLYWMWIVPLTITSIFLIKYALAPSRRDSLTDGEPVPVIGMVVGCIAGLVAFVLAGADGLPKLATILINPDYATIQKIASLINGGT